MFHYKYHPCLLRLTIKVLQCCPNLCCFLMCTLRNIFLLITFDIHYHYRLIVIFRQKILTQKDHTHSRIFSSIQEGWHHFIFILSLLTEVHLLNVRLHKEVVEPAELNFFFFLSQPQVSSKGPPASQDDLPSRKPWFRGGHNKSH